MIRIDKDIPIPDKKKAWAWRKYPFPDMKVGDSFFVPKMAPGHLSTASKRYKVQFGMEFTSKRESNGARIWRIK